MPNTYTDIFKLDYSSLRGKSAFCGFLNDLERDCPIIDSNAAFNHYCTAVCRLWKMYFPDKRSTPSSDFLRLVQQIDAGAIPNRIIPTSWGGVVVTAYHHPAVEKYLVIRQGGYLALEKHSQKDEHLEVKEGAGMLLWRDECQKPLALQELRPGDEFHFTPGMEHCVIGTEDLLLFERSIDPLGMDQDLIFIYTPFD